MDHDYWKICRSHRKEYFLQSLTKLILRACQRILVVGGMGFYDIKFDHYLKADLVKVFIWLG